jgi:3-hydroxyisobutyrate dehydrogenase
MAPQFSPGHTRIGWIGTGVMGRSMCGHLLDVGYAVTLHTRTQSKAADLLARGARWADSPCDVAASADVVLSIVGYPQDVREVHLGEQGTLAGMRPGGVLVDMTSSQPALACEIADAATERGVVGIDAPVSGGDVGARSGTLSIMIGGDADTVARLEPIWQRLGAKWVRHGGPGAGQHTKLVNQVLIASNMIGVSEALLYAYRAGLDLTKVLESVSSGAAGSWSLSNLGPRMVGGDFAPGFFVEHFLKDMRIALDESRRMGLALPGLTLAERLYEELSAQGHARDGTQALVLAIGRLSKVDWPRHSERKGAAE